MRVLMLAQFYAPIIGGEERMVEAMSVALADRGHEVTIATLHHEGLAEREVHRGVSVRRITSSAQRLERIFSESGRRHAMPVPDPETTMALRALVRELRPDVVHAHNWLVHSYLPLKRAGGPPLVYSLHDHSLVCAKKRLMRGDMPCDGPGLAKCVACAGEHYGWAKGTPVVLGLKAMRPVAEVATDLFLPISRSVAETSGLAQGGLPHEVLPNFLPDDVMRAAQTSEAAVPGLPDDGFIMMAGDLTADKGADLLLDAYAELRSPPPLVLIGRPYSERLSDPPPGVVALGKRPHKQVIAAWRRCAVAVAPSRWPEPFGLVALEAMAAGAPIVAAAHGGLLDFLDDDTGELVTPGDAGALRDALGRLLADRALRERLGRVGAQRAGEFSEVRIVPRLEAAYERVLRARGPVASLEAAAA